MKLRHDPDIVLGKLANIQEALDRIDQTRSLHDTLEAWMLEDLFTLYLQRAIEACIDVANHLIAKNNWTTPSSSAEAFAVLRDQSVFDADFTKTLISMVGFRNMAVHAYGVLDRDIVRHIIEHCLQDIEVFARRIVEVTVG